jgi:hypothetical protein
MDISGGGFFCNFNAEKNTIFSFGLNPESDFDFLSNSATLR